MHSDGVNQACGRVHPALTIVVNEPALRFLPDAKSAGDHGPGLSELGSIGPVESMMPLRTVLSQPLTSSTLMTADVL